MGRATARRAGTLALIAAALAGCGEIPDYTGAPPDPLAKPLGSAVTLDPLRADEEYHRALFSTFTSVTPENELKWEIVEPRRGDFAFGRADELIAAAARERLRVRGHPLVWDLQLPKWVREAPREELESILRTHVRRLAAHDYGGPVAQWDVVNEPLEDDGTMTRNVFLEAMGEGYIDIAFREARAAAPRARLFLNETAAERGIKADALVALAHALRERGVPIDGVGLQNHTTSDDFPTRADLERLMRRLRPLDVEITEMDVSGPREHLRTAAYTAAAEACAAAPNCTGLTVWGVTDRRSWLGAGQQATLFDAEGRAKPALAAVRRALRQNP